MYGSHGPDWKDNVNSINILTTSSTSCCRTHRKMSKRRTSTVFPIIPTSSGENLARSLLPATTAGHWLRGEKTSESVMGEDWFQPPVCEEYRWMQLVKRSPYGSGLGRVHSSPNNAAESPIINMCVVDFIINNKPQQCYMWGYSYNLQSALSHGMVVGMKVRTVRVWYDCEKIINRWTKRSRLRHLNGTLCTHSWLNVLNRVVFTL